MRRDLAFQFKDTRQWPELLRWLRHYLAQGIQGGPLEVAIARPNRTKDQNRKMWPGLRDISRQIDWPRGTGAIRQPEEWKMILMSAYRQETNVVPGLNGEFINLSLSSSELNKAEFSEFLAFMEAQGAEWGVRWSDPALQVFDQYREAA